MVEGDDKEDTTVAVPLPVGKCEDYSLNDIMMLVKHIGSRVDANAAVSLKLLLIYLWDIDCSK